MLVDLIFHFKQSLFCSFVDYKKAFLTVWRKGLWPELNYYGIPKTSKIYEIVIAMYKNVKLCVFINNSKSGYFVINKSVRQEENLSPLLYILFVPPLSEADAGELLIWLCPSVHL